MPDLLRKNHRSIFSKFAPAGQCLQAQFRPEQSSKELGWETSDRYFPANGLGWSGYTKNRGSWKAPLFWYAKWTKTMNDKGVHLGLLSLVFHFHCKLFFSRILEISYQTKKRYTLKEVQYILMTFFGVASVRQTLLPWVCPPRSHRWWCWSCATKWRWWCWRKWCTSRWQMVLMVLGWWYTTKWCWWCATSYCWTNPDRQSKCKKDAAAAPGVPTSPDGHDAEVNPQAIAGVVALLRSWGCEEKGGAKSPFKGFFWCCATWKQKRRCKISFVSSFFT